MSSYSVNLGEEKYIFINEHLEYGGKTLISMPIWFQLQKAVYGYQVVIAF